MACLGLFFSCVPCIPRFSSSRCLWVPQVRIQQRAVDPLAAWSTSRFSSRLLMCQGGSCWISVSLWCRSSMFLFQCLFRHEHVKQHTVGRVVDVPVPRRFLCTRRHARRVASGDVASHTTPAVDGCALSQGSFGWIGLVASSPSMHKV